MKLLILLLPAVVCGLIRYAFEDEAEDSGGAGEVMAARAQHAARVCLKYSDPNRCGCKSVLVMQSINCSRKK